MIVVDASVIIDYLLGIDPYFEKISARLSDEYPNIFAPQLIDVEVAQVIRRFNLRKELSNKRAFTALSDMFSLPIVRYTASQLINRAFELRNNVTIYDGLYLSLAEGTGAALITRDNSLEKVSGCDAKVEVL